MQLFVRSTTLTTFVLLLAPFNVHAQTYDVALVVGRQPNVVTVFQQQCLQIQTQTPGGSGSVGGALLSGAIGAALGNQVGRGDGRTVATAVGAVLGSQIGSQPAQPSGYELRHVCNYVPVQTQQGEIISFEYRGRRFSHSFP
jgi:uncharacterized protein YcfJ